LGIDNKVKFLNLRTDVDKLLQGFDIVVFPSKLEGLPLSIIEAQAAGLPCLLSDRVASETAITDLVSFEPLNNTPEQWSNAIERKMDGFERKNSEEKIKEAGYDIHENAHILEKIYLSGA
jgi:glycosyltransferase involved in cell wall biosynthesis